MLKKRMSIILLICLFSSAFSKETSYNMDLIGISVPDGWLSTKTLMASMKGFYLHTNIDGKKHRFFIHSHKPATMATRSGAERFYKDYIENKYKAVGYTCSRINDIMAYQCYSFIKNEKEQWSIDMMFWFQDKERLFLNLDDLSSQGEAQKIYKEIKVALP